MIKFALGCLFAAPLAWLITADHYGHILRGDPTAGIACRIYDLQTVRYGHWGETVNLCVDLSGAIPERQLWDELKAQIENNFAGQE